MKRPRPPATDAAGDLSRRLDALARRRWTTEREGLARMSVGGGDGEITVYARPEAAAALTGVLSDAGDALDEADAALREQRADLARLHARIETLERERDAVRRGAAATPASGAGAARQDRVTGRHAEAASRPVTLEDVPTALIAPFHPDRRTLAAAKENPLVALAVQATKAMQPDADELERARLLAMAYAASTGDLARFWAARTQRSTKKLR